MAQCFMVRPHRKACQRNLHSLTSYERLNLQKKHCSKAKKGVIVWATKKLCGYLYLCILNIKVMIILCSDWRWIIKTILGKLSVWFRVHVHKIFIYLGRCWRWIRKPDSQTDSSQIGASTPDSTFSWTARQKEERGGGRERERKKNVISFHWGKTREKLWYKIQWKIQQCPVFLHQFKNII